MVVADEVKIQEEPNPFYRWNKRQNTPIVKIRRDKQSVSFYGGLSLKTKKVISHLCYWQNSKETIKFLNLIKDKYKDKGKILLVWDNASWHKSKAIRQWLAKNNKTNWLELLNFPPYSPELNPQERVWKALRKHLSTKVGLYTFKETIDQACHFLLTGEFDYRFVY